MVYLRERFFLLVFLVFRLSIRPPSPSTNKGQGHHAQGGQPEGPHPLPRPPPPATPCRT
ncbi:hypothetical protein [Thermus scotoductus]|uniref:hypothetical protein n=1 Tax=Thermus scotoductus TaxID=37636 RepID=UPI001562E222|nr:hypothetical protein [Thermus scotoductus]